MTKPYSVIPQVAIKNNIDVLYFACLIPLHVYFTEDGQMDKRIFLSTWKEIPTQNEVQYNLSNMTHNSGTTNKEILNKTNGSM